MARRHDDTMTSETYGAPRQPLICLAEMYQISKLEVVFRWLELAPEGRSALNSCLARAAFLICLPTYLHLVAGKFESIGLLSSRDVFPTVIFGGVPTMGPAIMQLLSLSASSAARAVTTLEWRQVTPEHLSSELRAFTDPMLWHAAAARSFVRGQQSERARTCSRA